ncbi:MAG: DMT family transporter [Candidatus Thermoplasmatota archaeon]|nr:DMT family transporter [Candidatus Thermoplasmatota archaeon]
MGNGKHLGVHGLMILVVFSWGMAWAVGRILALGLPPMTGAWLRYVLTMVLFYAWFAARALKGSQVNWLPSGRQTWRTLTLIAVTGVLGYQLFFMNGMSLTAAGDASLIITFNPIFTVLLAAPMLGQQITRRMFLGLFCGFIGVVVVTGWSPNTDIPFEDRIIGDFMILLAALCWAMTTNNTKRMMERRNGEKEATTLEIVVWYSLIGTALLTPLAAWETWQNGIPEPTVNDWYAIIYLAAISTVLAYYWFAIGVEKLGATAAASYIFLMPVFGVLGGVLLLDEKLGWTLFLGFILIVMGVRVVQRESERLSTA